MSYCENYFKPCEWFSRCYGHNFSDGVKNLSLTDSINATTVVAPSEELL